MQVLVADQHCQVPGHVLAARAVARSRSSGQPRVRRSRVGALHLEEHLREGVGVEQWDRMPGLGIERDAENLLSLADESWSGRKKTSARLLTQAV